MLNFNGFINKFKKSNVPTVTSISTGPMQPTWQVLPLTPPFPITLTLTGTWTPSGMIRPTYNSREITKANLALVSDHVLVLINKDTPELPKQVVMPRATALHFLIRYEIIDVATKSVIDDADMTLFYKKPATDEEYINALTGIQYDDPILQAAIEAYDPTSPWIGVSGLSGDWNSVSTVYPVKITI